MMYFKIVDCWYRSSLTFLTWLLLPFSLVFRGIIFFRRLFYRKQILSAVKLPVPVIVVGNITVGGTGKTPFVIWLAKLLQAKGYKPGIVLRGAGGRVQVLPLQITMETKAKVAGDEALVLVRHAQCPVVACVDRVAAAQYLLAKTNCDVVISDDGLQHYRLARDIEVAILDGNRLLGNHCLLPAGPLREPVSRLQQVNFVVINSALTRAFGTPYKKDIFANAYAMQLVPNQFVRVKDNMPLRVDGFPRQRVHAVAGIGNPERFFLLLEVMGLAVVRHAFPDHYSYQQSDLDFADGLPIIMTEKDAVKCQMMVGDNAWFLQVEATVEDVLQHEILSQLRIHHDRVVTSLTLLPQVAEELIKTSHRPH